MQKDRRNKTNNGKASKYKKKGNTKENNGISTNHRIHFIVFISFEDLFGFFIFSLCRKNEREREGENHFFHHQKRIFFYFFFFFLDPFQKECKFFKRNNKKCEDKSCSFFNRYCVSFAFPRIGVSIQCFLSIAHIMISKSVELKTEHVN